MEKAVLKTLIYADIFDYPLKAWEIHKWLISKAIPLNKIEKTLKVLVKQKKIQNKKDFYFLKNRGRLVLERQKREVVSENHFKQVKFYCQFLKLIPWIKLVGVSGSLAIKNSKISDDIDLFIITSQNRLFLSRIFILLIFELLGKRRKRGENVKKVAGKLCTNILLEETSLAQHSSNIYLAHEVLQMKVLWEREGCYARFLEENEWAFRYLPNWSSSQIRSQKLKKLNRKDNKNFDKLTDFLEKIVKSFQLRYMGQILGKEKISDSSLYFLPENKEQKILGEYKKRSKDLFFKRSKKLT